MSKGKEVHYTESAGGGSVTRVGGFLIREHRREKMANAMSRGLHFADAAEKAGIPYEVAMSAANHDPEFMDWYDQSRSEGRARISKRMNKKKKPRTSLQIKSDFINKLCDVGLFDKIAVMAEMADPETREGKEILGFFMRYVVKDILPKETAAKIEHTEGPSYEGMSDEELLETLSRRRQERLEYSGEIENANNERSSHTGEYVKEIEMRVSNDEEVDEGGSPRGAEA